MLCVFLCVARAWMWSRLARLRADEALDPRGSTDYIGFCTRGSEVSARLRLTPLHSNPPDSNDTKSHGFQRHKITQIPTTQNHTDSNDTKSHRFQRHKITHVLLTKRQAASKSTRVSLACQGVQSVGYQGLWVKCPLSDGIVHCRRRRVTIAERG